MRARMLWTVGLTVLCLGLATVRRAEAVESFEASEIGYEAYHYFYPLVLMEITRRQATNSPAGEIPGRGPMNTFIHVRAFPPSDFKDVVRPNFDTLYSIAYLDLTGGPLVLSVPDTGDRYYMLPMLDMWSDVFANPGTRTTGNQAGRFLIAPAGWRGATPGGMTRINAPTGNVWIIGRTQTNGVKDYEAVHKIQDGYTLTRVADVGKEPRPAAPFKSDPKVDMKTPPMRQVAALSPQAFFALAAELMKKNPPHASDFDIVARMRQIGLEPGKDFDLSEVDPQVRLAVERGAKVALETMVAKAESMAPVINYWQVAVETMGVYGNSYLRRAVVAMVGLGANPVEDAVYPMTARDGEGRPLTGEHRYVLRFEKGAHPPAKAFWSITLYDAEGYTVVNELKRHALGDRDALQTNPDGSIELYLQAGSPGSSQQSNWLPAPAKGPFNLVLRIYWPQRSVLLGTWTPPAVKRVD